MNDNMTQRSIELKNNDKLKQGGSHDMRFTNHGCECFVVVTFTFEWNRMIPNDSRGSADFS